MILQGKLSRLRPWRPDDADALLPIANNIKIARNLTTRFPHPYTEEAAHEFLERTADESQKGLSYCIEVGGCVAGGMGARQSPEAIYLHTFTCGYWLGEAYWGRGIATEAFGIFVAHLFREFPAQRVEASVFGWNPASARVLEKNGFVQEGRRRQAICRFGEFTDEIGYGLLRAEWESQRGWE
ncbi:MAG: N-acetyltransferase [Candidatus Hydrogenedentota bacterium]